VGSGITREGFGYRSPVIIHHHHLECVRVYLASISIDDALVLVIKSLGLGYSHHNA
jgi:hypothetical protein